MGVVILGIAVLVLLGVILFLLLRCLIRKLFRFYGVKKLIGDSAKKRRIATIVMVLIIAGCCWMDFVNTVIVVIHLDVFFLLGDFLERIIRKLSGKQSRYYWQGAVAVIAVILYLAIGYYNAYHVSETRYELKTAKDLNGKSLRIVQISDSHVGTTFDGAGFEEHLKVIQKTQPDVVVVTGDFVDDGTSKEDMIRSCQALGTLQTTYGTYMIWGNHDKGYYNSRGYSLEEVKTELEKNQITVLEDETVLIDDRFYLIGRLDRSFQERKTAEEMVKDLDSSKYMIMLDHQPNDYDAEEKTEVDLVLSGHSHGGQMIPIGITGELSGANDKTYGMEVRNKTTFIVNSGISDWAIKFKTGTFSEYGVIDIKE